MTYATSFLIATLITATVLKNTSMVLAQEWKVLLGQGIFQTDQLSQEMKKNVMQPKRFQTKQTNFWLNLGNLKTRPNNVMRETNHESTTF